MHNYDKYDRIKMEGHFSHVQFWTKNNVTQVMASLHKAMLTKYGMPP